MLKDTEAIDYSGVINNLLFVYSLENTGHRFVIDSGERYYGHKVSGVRNKIHRIRNVYFVEYDILPYNQNKAQETVRGMHASNSHACFRKLRSCITSWKKYCSHKDLQKEADKTELHARDLEQTKIFGYA